MPQPSSAGYWGHGLVNKGFLLALHVNISPVQQLLPALSQDLSFHHALRASFVQWQLQVSHCTECLFSLGGQPMLCLFPVSTCLLLLMAASLCIPLDCSASFCILCVPVCPPAHLGGRSKVSGQWAGSCSTCFSHWDAVKSEGARLAGGCVCSVCSEAFHTVCPSVYF